LSFYHSFHDPGIRASYIYNFYPFSFSELYTLDDILYTTQFWYKPLSFEEVKVLLILGNAGLAYTPLHLSTDQGTGNFRA
jgi:hypothetical protein